MRNYQTLSLVGAILTLVIGLGAYGAMGSLVNLHSSFSDWMQKYSDTQTLQKYNADKARLTSDAQLVTSLMTAGTVLMIGTIVVTFAIKEETKPVGIFLIVVSVGTLITFGLFGIIGFGLFLAGGITALRFEKKEMTPIAM